MKEFILTVILVLAIGCMLLSIPISLVYTIYLWGSVGLVFSASLWGGVLLWLKLLGGGLMVMLTAMALGAKLIKGTK